MGTIVVGVAGSETSQAACREAATLAQALGSRLHLVTAVHPSEAVKAGVGSDTFAADSVEDAELMLDRTQRSLPKDLTVTSSVITAKPADAIIDEAKEEGADLIVVGNVNMQGMRRALGSVANEVSHHAPCSVYIAKTT